MLYGTGPPSLVTARLGLSLAHGRRAVDVPMWARRHALALRCTSLDQPTARYSSSATYSETLSLTRTRPALTFTRKTLPLSIAIASFCMYTTATSVFGQGVVYCVDERNYSRKQKSPPEPYVISDSNASSTWIPPIPSRPPRHPHDETELDLQKILMSGGIGFGVGYLVKKVSNLVLLLGVLGYGGIVLLRVKGFDINFEEYWPHLEPTYTRALDLDGDGRVTEGDLRQVAKNVIDFFKRYLQSDMSFMVGFLAGLYYA